MTLDELITDLKAAGANENTMQLAMNCYELGLANAQRKALAQPEQEPDKYVMDIECTKCGAKQSGVLTVNTTPPQRPQNCGTGYCSCIECVMKPKDQGRIHPLV